jgi:hypothetical protein
MEAKENGNFQTLFDLYCDKQYFCHQQFLELLKSQSFNAIIPTSLMKLIHEIITD